MPLIGDRSGDIVGQRGQSSVVGLVLVIGMTVLGITSVLLFGVTAIQDAQTQSEIGSAEHAMTQLDSQFSLVALGDSAHQSAALPGRSGTSIHVDEDRGWMNVSVVNRSSGDVDMTIFNTTMGAVIYENDDTTIAYQGGGVWKRAPTGGSVMISPPEFHYRTTNGQDPTLTLPLVVVRGGGTINDEARISKGDTLSKFPIDGVSDRSNPLEGGEINITVRSEYYEAWGAFFEDRTGGDVEYDHVREQVTVDLHITSSEDTVGGGIVSGAAGTTLDFHNHAEADSYNSSDGDYDSTSAENTSVIVAGDFVLGNQGTLFGDLEAGGSVTLNNNAEITGNVSHGGSLTNQGTIGGWSESGADVNAPSSIGWLIDDRREAINGSNNNGPEGDVDETTNTLTGCDSQCDLEGGQEYYLEEIDIGDGDNLLLNTTGGDIEVVVDGDVNLGDATVNVTGDGTVRFYIEDDLNVGGDGNVSVPQENSTQMWFYMNPRSTAEFGNGARFVGVVYGPGNGAQNGVEINFNNHFTLYGGLVGDVPYVNNHMDIHFDEALTQEDPLGGHTDEQPTVTYMHITVNEVNVTSG